MSESTNRISRIQSLISKDLASIDGRRASAQPSSQAVGQLDNPAQYLLEQEKRSFEDYQLAKKARQQRISKRQELLRVEAEEKAKRERQRQEAKAIEREHRNELSEKRKQQFRLGNIASAPAGRVVNSSMRDAASSDVLLLTQLVQKGQVASPFSRFDSRSFSPFSHRESFPGGLQRGYARGLLFWLLNFFISPFFLLWRVILFAYYFAISLPSYCLPNKSARFAISIPSLLGHRLRFSRLLLGLWYFSTAPLHMLAHSIIDPLGIFTREPHNYARQPIRVYVRIFTYQTLMGIRSLPGLVTRGCQRLAFFLLAPLLLLPRVVFSPYRYLRQFSLLVLSSGVLDKLEWFYRRTRIRTMRTVQSFIARFTASSRVQRVSLQHQVSQFLSRANKLLARIGKTLQRRIILGSQQLAARLKRKKFDQSVFGKRLPTVPDLLTTARSAKGVEKPSPTKEVLQTLPKALQDFPSTTEFDDRVGLLSKTEDTGLEDFLAADVDAIAKVAKQEPALGMPAQDSTSDKESVYKEMDEISYHLRSHKQAEPPSGDSVASGAVKPPIADEDKSSGKMERIFENIDELDEDARTLLLERLSKQLEGDKLR